MFLEQKLDEMQEQLKNLNQFMMMLMPDLSSKKNVQHFLQISRQTMVTYMKEGIIKEDEHYFFDENGNEVFIPDEIIKLRAKGFRKKPNGAKSENANRVLAEMGITL
jgi:5-bromo-4-chloroindolyl phosphate hydrolysis protein